LTLIKVLKFLVHFTRFTTKTILWFNCVLHCFSTWWSYSCILYMLNWPFWSSYGLLQWVLSGPSTQYSGGCK